VAIFARFMRERDTRDAGQDPTLYALGRLGGELVTRTRRQLVDDARWRASVSLNEYRRPAGAEECVYTLAALPAAGTFSLVGLHRPCGEPGFSTRQRRLLHLFHGELGRLIGPVLVSAGDPFSPTRLPPRVREALSCLLEGDGEKQAAARMGLSRETVHQYVKALYRHYRVESRAELLARVLRRPAPGD
jgi:DNA-binding CsgD family transcriptional regulator